MNAWVTLHEKHEDLRSAVDEIQSLRTVLSRLAEAGHIERSIYGRFTYKVDKDRRSWGITPRDRGEAARWTEPLLNLAPDLGSAGLTLLALTDRSNRTLLQFTVMVEGTSVAGQRFTIAVHLDDERKGGGACSHALLHCHVGPSLDDAPKVRVPFPAVGPVEILDWALSVVLPGWEPAPWASIPARMRP